MQDEAKQGSAGFITVTLYCPTSYGREKLFSPDIA